jgi:ribonuclease R
VHRIAKSLLASGVSGHGVLVAGEPHAKKQRTGNREQGSEKHKAPRWERHPADASFFAGEFGISQKPAEVIPEADLALVATESSDNERRASEAERELVEWKKARFMEQRVGEEFDGLIISATRYGLFVELADLFVEGLLPIDSLPGDHFVFHENVRKIVGQRTRREFSIGDKVRVLLERVDPAERKLQFALVEDEAPRGKAKRKRARRG